MSSRARCTAEGCSPAAARPRNAHMPQEGCLQHHAHATLLMNDARKRCCWLAQPYLVMLQVLTAHRGYRCYAREHACQQASMKAAWVCATTAVQCRAHLSFACALGCATPCRQACLTHLSGSNQCSAAPAQAAPEEEAFKPLRRLRCPGLSRARAAGAPYHAHIGYMSAGYNCAGQSHHALSICACWHVCNNVP